MKYTVNRVLYLGIVCYVLMVIVSLLAETTSEYLLALVLLGLGWNFFICRWIKLISQFS